MDDSNSQAWLEAVNRTVDGYRRMIDAIVEQLTDEELHIRPAPGINSVAIVLRHLGGNLRSRWTDFLTSDGEKPDRDRDCEFDDWQGDRESLLEYFDGGWKALTTALAELSLENIQQTIQIRGESHSVPQAVLRSITHLSYHVGQIAMVARMVHTGDWKWLTVEPGKSQQFNQQTWGTAGSPSVMGAADDPTLRRD